MRSGGRPLSARNAPVVLLLLALLFVVLPVTPRVAAAEEGADLRPRWKVGRQLVQKISTTQKQNIYVPGMATPMQQDSKQNQEIALTVVKEREAGGHELELEFRSIDLETRMGGQVIMQYDSKTASGQGTGNPMTAMFGKMVGAKFTLLTTPDGEVEKVEGVQRMIDTMSEGLSPAVAGMMQSVVSEDSLKQMSMMPQGLPNEPVKEGEEWPVKTETSLGPMGTIQISMTMTFKGWETRKGRKCAVLDHKGFLSSKSGDTTGTMSIKSLTGTTSGRTWYAPELGAVVDSFANQKMKMRMDAMGQEVKLDMDQRVTNRLVSVEE